MCQVTAESKTCVMVDFEQRSTEVRTKFDWELFCYPQEPSSYGHNHSTVENVSY